MAAATRRTTRRPKVSASLGRSGPERAASSTARREGSRHRSSSPVASTILGLLQDVVTKFATLSEDVQKKFTAWADYKHLDSHKQAGFANELDRWVGRGRRMIANLESALEAAESLPALKICTPIEREAKTIVAGLKAIECEELLRETVREMQSLANHARQPLPPKESARLWTEFGTFVARLAKESDLLADILQLIDAAKAKVHELVCRGNSGSAAESKPLQTSSSGSEAQGLSLGDVATEGLTKLRTAIEKYTSALEVTRNDLLPPEAGRHKSLLDHQQDVLFSLQRYEHNSLMFVSYLENDAECRELMSGNNSISSPIRSRLKEIIQSLSSGTAWCRIWLARITIRESMAYRLPKGIPDTLAKMVGKLADIGKRLHKLGSHKPVAKVELSSLGPEAVTILRRLQDKPPAGRGHTVRTLAAAAGMGEQKLRRILVSQLGDRGLGVVAVDKGKHGEGEGTQKYSPPHAYLIAPEYIDQVQDFLQGR